MAKNVPSLVGERFGRWVVLDKAEKGKSGETQYFCRCDCGSERIIRRTSLTTGNSKSCGCLSRDVAVKSNTKHGDTDKRLYRIWAGIIQRCCNNRSRYEWEKYGGRGICVCEEWHDINKFAEWVEASGYVPGLTIDRIDPLGNYEPSNCQWLTRSENSKKQFADRKKRSKEMVEVVHANWDNNGICTMCGYPIPTDSKCDFIDEDDCLFCYHCGAKMDGDRNG